MALIHMNRDISTWTEILDFFVSPSLSSSLEFSCYHHTDRPSWPQSLHMSHPLWRCLAKLLAFWRRNWHTYGQVLPNCYYHLWAGPGNLYGSSAYPRTYWTGNLRGLGLSTWFSHSFLNFFQQRDHDRPLDERTAATHRFSHLWSSLPSIFDLPLLNIITNTIYCSNRKHHLTTKFLHQ